MFDNISNSDVQTYLYDLNPSSPSNRPVVSSNGKIMDDPLLRSSRQIRLTVYPDGSVRASNDLNPRLRNGNHTFERPHYVKSGNTVYPTVGRQRMAGDLFQDGIGSEQWFSSFDEAAPFIDSITQDNRYVPHEIDLLPYSDQHTVVNRNFPSAVPIPGTKQLVGRSWNTLYGTGSSFKMEPQVTHVTDWEQQKDIDQRQLDDVVINRSMNGRTIDEVLDTPTDPRVLRNVEATARRRDAASQVIKDKDELINSLVNKVNQGISDSPKRVDYIPPTRQEVYDRLASTDIPVTNSKPAPAPRTKTGRLRATAKRVIRPFMDGPTLESLTF